MPTCHPILALRHAGLTFAVAVAGVVALAGTSQAGVIFNDTFASGTGAWYRANSGTGAGTLSNASGELSWSWNANSSREVIGRSFSSQTVGVGDTLRLSFDFRQTVASVSILRAGLFDVTNPIIADNWAASGDIGAWSGYYTFVRDDSATGNISRQESGATASASLYPTLGGTSLTTDLTQYDINQDGTVTYKGVFEVTRTSLTQIDTLFTLSSGATTHFSITGTTSIVQGSFDTAVLRIAGGTALFDNIKVESIPEPASLALAGLGMLLVIAACIARSKKRLGATRLH